MITSKLEKSWKYDNGEYTLEFSYDDFVHFRLYARLGEDKRFKFSHGKPWDHYTGKKMQVSDYPGLNMGYRDAYRIAAIRLNGATKKLEKAQLSLFEDTNA